MNLRRWASASTSPSASGVSRPFRSTAAARSTRYAPPWPCMRSQSVPISYAYQRRNGKNGPRWRSGRSTPLPRLRGRVRVVVCPWLARPKADQGGEDEREGGGDDQAGPDACDRGDDASEQRTEAEAQGDGARPDPEDGRLYDSGRLESGHRAEGRDQGAAEKAGDHEGGDQKGSRGGGGGAEEGKPQQQGTNGDQPPVPRPPQQTVNRERSECGRNPGGGKGDAGQDLRFLRTGQVQKAQDHELLRGAIAGLLQPLRHDQHSESPDRARSRLTKHHGGARSGGSLHPPWALADPEQHRDGRKQKERAACEEDRPQPDQVRGQTTGGRADGAPQGDGGAEDPERPGEMRRGCLRRHQRGG